MDLDIVGPRLHMLADQRADIGFPNHGDRQPHGKKAVCILAEDLPVKEVAPPADDLADHKPVADRVQKEAGIRLPVTAEKEDDDHGQDDAAVDGKPPAPQVEDLQQVILVEVPHKGHIIDAGPDDRRDHDPGKGIPVEVGILPRLFCDVRGDHDAGQHRGRDQDPVEGDPEISDHDRLGNIPKIDTQIRKGYIHISHHLLHRSTYSVCNTLNL